MHEELIRQVADGTLSRMRRMVAAMQLRGAVPLDDETYRRFLSVLPQMAANLSMDDAQAADVIAQCTMVITCQIQTTQEVSDATASALRQLIQDPHPHAAAAAMSHTGELRERGRFALDTILQRVASFENHFPESSKLRGVAFLAAYRIDPASVHAAQYSAARQDCLELVAGWLQDYHARGTETAFMRVLTQEYEAIASWES